MPAILTKPRRVARIQARAIRTAIAKRAPERPREARHGDFRFQYPSRSLVGRAVAEGIAWDEYLLGVAFELPPGALVCEVGSNIGASLLTMAGARPDLRFVCFEPSTRFLPYLRANIEVNGLADRVTVEQRLVGPDGEQWRLTSNTSTGSVVDGTYDGHIPLQTEAVTSVGLDGYFAARGEAPTFVKIDTDGFDVKVLRSATGLLRDAHPTVSLEYTPTLFERVGDHADDVRRLLLDAGYLTAELYRGDGRLLRRDHPLTETIETESYLDMIVRRPSG